MAEDGRQPWKLQQRGQGAWRLGTIYCSAQPFYSGILAGGDALWRRLSSSRGAARAAARTELRPPPSRVLVPRLLLAATAAG